MDDPYERRALLLHLGDVLECVFCLSKLAKSHASIGDALEKEDSLASFAWLSQVDPAMPPQELIERAMGAFFGWPKGLLDEPLNRKVLASTVQHDLFAGNSPGWSAYMHDRRKLVPWFGEGLAKEVETLAHKLKEPAPAADDMPAPAHTTLTKAGKAKTVRGEPNSTHTGSKPPAAEDSPSRYATWPWPDKPKDM